MTLQTHVSNDKRGFANGEGGGACDDDDVVREMINMISMTHEVVKERGKEK